jgi:hypothetical protein
MKNFLRHFCFRARAQLDLLAVPLASMGLLVSFFGIHRRYVAMHARWGASKGGGRFTLPILPLCLAVLLGSHQGIAWYSCHCAHLFEQ